MDKCDECRKGVLREKKVDYFLFGQNLGKYNALVCDSCHETVFTGETVKVIEKKAKEKGMWGMAAKTRIGTSGNALDVKLHKAIVNFMHLKKGQEIVVEPINEKRFQVEVI